MKFPRGCPTHTCAPKEWRRTPNITGSFELDAMIHHNPNKNMADRLAFYAGDLSSFAHRGADSDRENAYGPLTGYDGYDGYSGDN